MIRQLRKLGSLSIPPSPSGILALLTTVPLVGLALVLGWLMGNKIFQDEWPILITATGLAVYIAVAVIDVRHAFLLWIATAPFARFVYLNLELGHGIPNLTLNRVMTGVLLALVLAQLAGKRRPLTRFTWADFFLVLFGMAGAFSVSSSVLGPVSGIQSFFDLIGMPIVIYFLARNLIRTRRDFRAVMVMLIVVGVYLAFLATREQLTGNVWFYPEDRSVQYTRSIRRVVGLLGNPAYISVTIGMAVPWAWYLFLKARRHRLALLALIGLMMAGIYFCMNRSGWLGLLVALVTMALLIKRFRKIFVALALVAGLVASTYWALIITSATVQERLQAQAPIEYRFETWNIALRMIRDNPVFGIGYGNFPSYYRRYGQWDIYLRATPTPHNTYLSVMLMGGVVAFVPFALFLAAVVLSAVGLHLKLRLKDRPRFDPDLVATFLASLAAILVPAFLMDVLDGYYNTMIMFLIMGAFSGLVYRESQSLAGMRVTPPQPSSPVAATTSE